MEEVGINALNCIEGDYLNQGSLILKCVENC